MGFVGSVVVLKLWFVSKQITRVWHKCSDLLLAHINIIQIPFTDPFCLLILALHDS